MNNATIKAASLALAIGTAFSLGACSVEKTQEGEMPKVEVDAQGGQLPKYDVDAAEVTVSTKPTEVTVPDVDINSQQATVQVPQVDVKTPAEQEAEQQ